MNQQNTSTIRLCCFCAICCLFCVIPIWYLPVTYKSLCLETYLDCNFVPKLKGHQDHFWHFFTPSPLAHNVHRLIQFFNTFLILCIMNSGLRKHFIQIVLRCTTIADQPVTFYVNKNSGDHANSGSSTSPTWKGDLRAPWHSCWRAFWINPHYFGLTEKSERRTLSVPQSKEYWNASKFDRWSKFCSSDQQFS